MGRIYDKPPIMEAVCEFRLTHDTRWDLTIPGLIYERMKGEFPVKEQRVIQELDVVQDSNGIKQKVRRSDRVLFLKENKRVFIQVGPHLLAINCLRPYPNWNTYKPIIANGFGVLSDIMGNITLQKISLHYINKIEIPDEILDLDGYFEFGINLGSQITQPMIDFIAGCTFSFADNRDLCRIQLTNIASELQGMTSFILDINYFLAKPGSFAKEEALDWIEHAHTKIEEFFEGCIKDKLRVIFGEVR